MRFMAGQSHGCISKGLQKQGIGAALCLLILPVVCIPLWIYDSLSILQSNLIILCAGVYTLVVTRFIECRDVDHHEGLLPHHYNPDDHFDKIISLELGTGSPDSHVHGLGGLHHHNTLSDTDEASPRKIGGDLVDSWYDDDKCSDWGRDTLRRLTQRQWN